MVEPFLDDLRLPDRKVVLEHRVESADPAAVSGGDEVVDPAIDAGEARQGAAARARTWGRASRPGRRYGSE